jgi:hypothetical protein
MLVVLMLVYTLAVHVLDPQEGDFIVDLCAAPGGKACMIAERIRYILSAPAHIMLTVNLVLCQRIY